MGDDNLAVGEGPRCKVIILHVPSASLAVDNRAISTYVLRAMSGPSSHTLLANSNPSFTSLVVPLSGLRDFSCPLWDQGWG